MMVVLVFISFENFIKCQLLFIGLKIDDRNVRQPCLRITFVLVNGGMMLNILNDQFIFHKVIHQLFWKIHSPTCPTF